MKLQDIINDDLTLSLGQLKTDEELVLDIQVHLYPLGLYPGGRWLDGLYGPRTEQAIRDFCDRKNLDSFQTGQFGVEFASALLNISQDENQLDAAKDRQRVFHDFLAAEVGYSAEKLAFLDQGIEKSPYKDDVSSYPDRLAQKPDGIDRVSAIANPAEYQPYPDVGQRPIIDESGLDFLHPDITEACLCLGGFENGIFQAKWLGREALTPVQFWSSTKIISVLNLICQLNTRFPYCDIDDCIVWDTRNRRYYKAHDLLVDMVTYGYRIHSSNAIAAMFKRFETFSGLDQWVKQMTGNNDLEFQGNYGQRAFIDSPLLVDRRTWRVVQRPANLEPSGQNLVSAYDLTRLLTMLAWHYHIPQSARLPGAQWYSLESLVRAMGVDTARYIDVAIAKLGLQSFIKSPVIISKLGFGPSDERHRTELTYTAFVQFSDRHDQTIPKPATLRTLAITLRAAKALNDFHREAIELDARVAAEITEILRRIITEELI